jgi:dienelactone hydrolase
MKTQRMSDSASERAATALGVTLLLAGCSSDPGGREPGPPSEASTTAGGDATVTGDSGLDDASDDTETGGEGPVGTRRTELAGHPLAEHPYFRRVQDFNDDESIVVAIDPAEFPDLDGQSCDVYVVAAKRAADWEQDDELNDVRPSGPTVLAVAGGLADTRLTIAAPGELSSDAGAGLGVAYDVVLDCDGDGRLGAGDVIDGGDPVGLYRTHDLTLTGPLEVAMFEAYAGVFLDQRTFHPSEIAAMGQLPLVVVTHGWSYNHTYYDYIGEHLASYGYIVMFHEADVQDGGPEGTLGAAITTLDNLDDLLANQDMLGDGVLAGHIDEHRIMLTGHSTGGEAVVRAVTELREGSYSSSYFGYDDIKLVSSMAPVSWHPRTVVDPGDIAYHMFVAGADDDVSGAPELSYTQCRSIYERAVGARQLTYIHGAGHGDLLGCCGELFIDENAPDLIGRAETNRVARGYFLALAELYLRENPAAKEFFTRTFADFHPRGIASHVVVTNEYRAARAGAVVLDDFESEAALDRSSSGGTVGFDVGNAAEVLMQDNDGSLAWTGSQPSNGMTHARHPGDDPHAIVFDWGPDADAFYEQAVVAAYRDFTAYEFLSFRVAQGTRHPATVALAGPLTFTVTLRDAAGASRSLGPAEHTSVAPPYTRAGFGAGTGWQNEFVTIRLRIRDFLGGSELDLTQIEAVRFEFGSSFGSSRGRIGLDDLELVP